MDSKEIILDDVITDIAAGPFGSNLKVSCFVEEGFPIIDGANLKGFKGGFGSLCDKGLA